MWDWLKGRSTGQQVQGETQVSMTPEEALEMADLKDSKFAVERMREYYKRLATERAEERCRLIALIREFTEADAELERHMADANLEDVLKRPPVFDRYDAAVAALKEAVK
jgi:hypothetical protein